MLSTLKLDEASELEFDVQVFGTSEQTTDIRFVIEGPEYSVSFPGKLDGGSVKVNIPKLKGILPAGVLECKMEVIVGGKLFSPLTESIEFSPLVEIDMKAKKNKVVAETVQVTKVKMNQPKSPMEEAVHEGYEIVAFGSQNLLKKDGKYHGIVSETKILKADGQAFSTITEMVNYFQSVN